MSLRSSKRANSHYRHWSEEMNATAESNKVTADIAKIQSEHKSTVIQEVAMLTAQLKNVEKDLDKILVIIKKIEKAENAKRVKK